MGKKRPTYDPEAIRLALGSIGTLAMTSSALREATSLGFDRAGVVETIAGIERRMFYKSMTKFADHRLWQDVYDVYHVPATMCRRAECFFMWSSRRMSSRSSRRMSFKEK